MNQTLPQSQWGMIASLLSLDAAAPFHEAMGLKWPDRTAYIKALRDMILANRTEFMANPSAPPPLAPKLRSVVDTLFGGAAADRFDRWARGTFKTVHADQPEWSGWHVALFRWVFGRKNNDLIGVTRVRPFVEERFRELADTAPLQARIDQAKVKPLSDWDLEMCSLRNWSVDADGANPFDIVVATFEIHAVQVFLPELAAKLNDREKRWFTDEARTMLGEMKLWLPGPLPAFDEMLRRVP